MKEYPDRSVVRGICGTLALAIFLSTTLWCEQCHIHHEPHIPETQRSTSTASSAYIAAVNGSDSTMTTTQPIFNDEYFKRLS